MLHRRSRDSKKERFWRRMVRSQAGSGRSVRAWCDQHGQRTSAFYWWRAELARRDVEMENDRGVASGQRAQPAFVPVQITQDSAAERGWLEIVLAGERRIRVSGRVDRQALADVLSVLTSVRGVEPEDSAC